VKDNIINIGEKNSKSITDIIELMIKIILVYYPNVDAVVMKNYYTKKDNKINTYLYLYMDVTRKILLPQLDYDFSLGNLNYNITTIKLRSVNEVLVNGRILFDKSKKLTNLRKNFEYMVNLKSKFNEHNDYVEIEPPIDIEKIKLLSK